MNRLWMSDNWYVSSPSCDSFKPNMTIFQIIQTTKTTAVCYGLIVSKATSSTINTPPPSSPPRFVKSCSRRNDPSGFEVVKADTRIVYYATALRPPPWYSTKREHAHL